MPLVAINLGVQALAAHPMKTEKRGLGEINQEVHFGGVTFVPGHFIYADNNGVLVAPHPLLLRGAIGQAQKTIQD